mmetsp:Transcript_13513/g.18507  ORF Transcript_13513/g.18507 Transcript_13513/m.18507 type:complete len:129 (-) Transcript_13513:72-458(-)
MHDFRRKMVDQILKEREKLPGYHDTNKKDEKSQMTSASTADPSPCSRMTYQEKEVRDNFTSYMSEIVSKNGEGGSKKDKSLEALKKRANKAIEGAKRYKSHFTEKMKEEAAEEEERTSRMQRASIGNG